MRSEQWVTNFTWIGVEAETSRAAHGAPLVPNFECRTRQFHIDAKLSTLVDIVCTVKADEVSLEPESSTNPKALASNGSSD